jgi:hypothetical protein
VCLTATLYTFTCVCFIVASYTFTCVCVYMVLGQMHLLDMSQSWSLAPIPFHGKQRDVVGIIVGLVKDLAAHELKDVKARRIILDAVKDHLIPHLSEKKSAREMFVALTNLFQSSNANRKMVLREKLRDTKMTRSDTVTSYLTKITQVRDQLAVVGEVVTDEELVRMTLNGFSKPWAPFIKGIVARETLPKFDRLWDDFIQEEIRRNL